MNVRSLEGQVRKRRQHPMAPAIAALLLGACTSAMQPRTAGNSADAAQLARERSAIDSAGARQTIAVTPFRVSSTDAGLGALGFALADLITTDLSRSSQLQLVERSRLGDVLREQDLARSGRVDSTTAPRVGRLLRARQLVLGSLDSLPNGELRLGVRVADVQSGTLQQALDARAPIADILDAEKAVVFRLFESMGVVVTPAERAQIEARRTSNVSALLAFGRGVQAELLGDTRRARDEYERALSFDPAFQPPAERISGIRAAAQAGDAEPLVSGNRTIGAPVSGTVDRLNRPLDLITSVARPSGGPSDPAFPSTIVNVMLRIRRP